MNLEEAKQKDYLDDQIDEEEALMMMREEVEDCDLYDIEVDDINNNPLLTEQNTSQNVPQQQ